ncbi:hypothetical protein RvY_18205 [Ramazzottius varieornatus]|uniref:Uncharacterized protein n=1 Tax=Ramazzottius varieornatus TaxID=947166 RepID=A0A1D1W4X4_RAMVA|nr:hypothetical protein RvY_18205 [Ramazzottius varieornatus]
MKVEQHSAAYSAPVTLEVTKDPPSAERRKRGGGIRWREQGNRPELLLQKYV